MAAKWAGAQTLRPLGPNARAATRKWGDGQSLVSAQGHCYRAACPRGAARGQDGAVLPSPPPQGSWQAREGLFPLGKLGGQGGQNLCPVLFQSSTEGSHDLILETVCLFSDKRNYICPHTLAKS